MYLSWGGITKKPFRCSDDSWRYMEIVIHPVATVTPADPSCPHPANKNMSSGQTAAELHLISPSRDQILFAPPSLPEWNGSGQRVTDNAGWTQWRVDRSEFTRGNFEPAYALTRPTPRLDTDCTGESRQGSVYLYTSPWGTIQEQHQLLIQAWLVRGCREVGWGGAASNGPAVMWFAIDFSLLK